MTLQADDIESLIAFIKSHEREDIPDDVWDLCMKMYDALDEHAMCGNRMIEKCEHAEKHNGKCLGYQKSEWNDEPTEQCERCEFYEGLKDGEQE